MTSLLQAWQKIFTPPACIETIDKSVQNSNDTIQPLEPTTYLTTSPGVSSLTQVLHQSAYQIQEPASPTEPSNSQENVME